MPLIGLGTYELLGKKCIETVKEALDIGYRHFDTAFAYGNHKEVGDGIRSAQRDQIFISTKLEIGLTQIDDENIEESVESTCDLALKELGLDYLDLLMIHWPDRSRPLEKIVAAMNKLIPKGKLRYAGVSNYTKHHLQDAYDADVSIAYNQVEFHPYLYQKELLEFAREHGTNLVAYRPFGKGELPEEEPHFAQIGQNYGKSAHQVILRWIIQKGIPVIPKASSRKHLQQNFSILDFELTAEEEKTIDQLDKHIRYCKTEWNEFDY